MWALASSFGVVAWFKPGMSHFWWQARGRAQRVGGLS